VTAPSTMPAVITLLTQADCAHCAHAKQVLARVSRDHRIEVEEIDIDSERGQRLATQRQVLFAPGVLLDKETFSYGRLSERRLRRALSRRTAHCD
jgi:glutaredoxin